MPPQTRVAVATAPRPRPYAQPIPVPAPTTSTGGWHSPQGGLPLNNRFYPSRPDLQNLSDRQSRKRRHDEFEGNAPETNIFRSPSKRTRLLPSAGPSRSLRQVTPPERPSAPGPFGRNGHNSFTEQPRRHILQPSADAERVSAALQQLLREQNTIQPPSAPQVNMLQQLERDRAQSSSGASPDKRTRRVSGVDESVSGVRATTNNDGPSNRAPVFDPIRDRSTYLPQAPLRQWETQPQSTVERDRPEEEEEEEEDELEASPTQSQAPPASPKFLHPSAHVNQSHDRPWEHWSRSASSNLGPIHPLPGPTSAPWVEPDTDAELSDYHDSPSPSAPPAPVERPTWVAYPEEEEIVPDEIRDLEFIESLHSARHMQRNPSPPQELTYPMDFEESLRRDSAILKERIAEHDRLSAILAAQDALDAAEEEQEEDVAVKREESEPSLATPSPPFPRPSVPGPSPSTLPPNSSASHPSLRPSMPQVRPQSPVKRPARPNPMSRALAQAAAAAEARGRLSHPVAPAPAASSSRTASNLPAPPIAPRSASPSVSPSPAPRRSNRRPTRELVQETRTTRSSARVAAKRAATPSLVPTAQNAPKAPSRARSSQPEPSQPEPSQFGPARRPLRRTSRARDVTQPAPRRALTRDTRRVVQTGQTNFIVADEDDKHDNHAQSHDAGQFARRSVMTNPGRSTEATAQQAADMVSDLLSQAQDLSDYRAGLVDGGGRVEEVREEVEVPAGNALGLSFIAEERERDEDELSYVDPDEVYATQDHNDDDNEGKEEESKGAGGSDEEEESEEGDDQEDDEDDELHVFM